MVDDIAIFSQFVVNLSGYVRSAAKDPARVDELNRFFNSVEWDDLIAPSSSLSRILWSIQNVLYLHESYGERVDADNRQASLVEIADRLDEVNLAQIRASLVERASV